MLLEEQEISPERKTKLLKIGQEKLWMKYRDIYGIKFRINSLIIYPYCSAG
jgi:hypothetical protein